MRTSGECATEINDPKTLRMLTGYPSIEGRAFPLHDLRNGETVVPKSEIVPRGHQGNIVCVLSLLQQKLTCTANVVTIVRTRNV